MNENSPRYLPRWKTAALFSIAQIGAFLFYVLFQRDIPIIYFLLASAFGWISLLLVLELRDKGKITLARKLIFVIFAVSVFYSVTSLGLSTAFDSQPPSWFALGYLSLITGLLATRKHPFWSS